MWVSRKGVWATKSGHGVTEIRRNIDGNPLSPYHLLRPKSLHVDYRSCFGSDESSNHNLREPPHKLPHSEFDRS